MYNLTTTVIECSDVQTYDYDVKVAMEEVNKTDEDGDPTGGKYYQNHLMQKPSFVNNYNKSG